MEMGKVIFGLTMSLDGFINDLNGSVASLYSDFAELRESESLRESIQTTGAVIMGKHTFYMEDPDLYLEDFEYQVPIFVLTSAVPQKMPRQNEKLPVTFITNGIQNAISQAKAAAHGLDVTIIGGAHIARQCIEKNLLDEIHIDIVPILLCKGLRLFENIGEKPIMLKKISVVDDIVRTHLKYQVIKPAELS